MQHGCAWGRRKLTALTILTILVIVKAKEIGTLEAKTRLSRLLAEVQRGQSFFITRHGKRIAELGPVRAAKRRLKPGFAKGTFTFIAPDFDGPLDDFREYEG